MKNNLKRILSFTLVLLMVLTAVFMVGCSKKEEGGEAPVSKLDPTVGRGDFINSIGGVSETYKGAVSEASFDTADAAAEAFVATEIVGSNTAVISGTQAMGTLSASEVSGLNLPADISEGIVQVDKIEVSYSLANGESVKRSKGVTSVDTLNTNKKVIVYVIKYENNWKYFSPMPVTGNTITKSYYDSVFNAEKYKNCTLETSMKMNAEAMGETIEMSVTQLIKHDGNKVYLEQTMVAYGETDKLCAYMEEVDGTLKCYIKQGDSTEWAEGYLTTIGFSKIEELTPFYDQYLDYTYFTKTDFGFELANENARKYFMTALGDAMSSMGNMVDTNNMDVDMYSEYYVCGGVLSGMRTYAEVSLNMNVQGQSFTMNEEVDSFTKVTNYGTTVVEKPFEE